MSKLLLEGADEALDELHSFLFAADGSKEISMIFCDTNLVCVGGVTQPHPPPTPVFTSRERNHESPIEGLRAYYYFNTKGELGFDRPLYVWLKLDRF